MVDVSSDESNDNHDPTLSKFSINQENTIKGKGKEKTVASVKTEIVEEEDKSDSESSSDESSKKLKILSQGKNCEFPTRLSINRSAPIKYESNLTRNKNTVHSLSDEETKKVSSTSLNNDSFSKNFPLVKNNSSDYLDSETSNQASTDSDSYNCKSKRSLQDFSSKEEPWLNQLKNKGTPVQHLADADYSKALHLEEISHDEDLFLIQCPKEIDPKYLRKNEMILNDSSSIAVKINGHSSKYDSFLVESESKRHVDLLLRSKENSKLQLGRFPLSGCLILSQSIDLPVLPRPALSPSKKVQHPEKLEKLCLSLPVADSPCDSSNFCTVSELKNTKKTKIKPEKDKSCSSDSGIESPRKKQNLKDTNKEMTSFDVSTVDALLSNIKKKKKKKKIQDSDIPTVENSLVEKKIKTEPIDSFDERGQWVENIPVKVKREPIEEYIEPEDSEIMPPLHETALENHKKRRRPSDPNETYLKSSEYPRTENIVTNVHKKRKKKHQDSDTTAHENSFEEIKIKIEPEESFDERDSQLVKKKKKKSKDPVTDYYLVPDKSVEVEHVTEEDCLLEMKKKKKKRKTELVPVIEMPCDSGVYPLNIDGVTAEDDLFLIQCPTEVDPKLLIDKEIVLSGKCRINLGDSLNPAPYDYFTIEEQSQRPVDVLLPNQCHNSIQIGRFPLSGSTILSTSTEVPESGTAKFPPLKRGLLSPNTSSNKNKSSASIDQEKYRTSELTSQEERHMNLRISSTEPILISQINDSTFKPAQQNLNVEDSDSSEWQSIYEQESKHENKKRRFALSPSACVNLHKFKTPPVLPSKAVEPFTHLQDLGKYSLSERSLPSIDQPLEYYSVFEKIDSTSKSQEIIGDEGREEVDQLPASQNSESGFSHFLSPSKSKKRRKKKDSLDKNSEIELTSSLHQSPEKESESVSSFSNHRKVSADDDESRDVDQLTTSQTSESVFSQFLSPSKSKRRRKKEDSLGKNSETEFTSLFLQSPKKESESDTASSSLTHRRGSIVDGQKHMFPVAHSQRIKLFNEIVNVKLDSQPLREDNIFSPDGQLFEDLPVPGKNYSPGNSERLEDNEALSSKSQHPEILLLSEGSGSTLKNVERPGGVEYIIPDNEVPNPSSPSKNSNSSSNKGEEFILPGKPFTKPQLANNTFSSSFSLELGDISEESEYILPAYIAPIQTKSSDVPEFHVIPRKDNEDKSEPEGQAKSDEFILPENNCHLTSESTTSKRKKKKKKKSRDEYLVEDNVVAQPTEISVTEEQAVSENSSTSALDSSDKKNIKKKRKKNKNDPMDYEVHSVLPVNFETSQPANVQSKVITEFSIKKKRKKKKRSLAEDPVDDILQRILPADLEEPYVESVRSKVPNESVSKKKRKKNILIEVSEEGSTPSVLPFELETLYHESSQPAGLNESVSRKKKKKRKRSLEESFENEIMLTNEECPIIVPSSDDIKPPKKKKKKKKNNSEEESFENEIMLTNEECPIIVPSSDDIKPPKKKKKKKKNNSEDLLKNVLENSADVSTFGEESSMGNDKYKTEVEFVVHELKPDIRNPDISSLYKKEKKKKNKLEDDANSVLIQNLLQNEYKKFDKKQKKRKSSKDSLIDPLAEVGTAEQSAPELSYESGIFDKKDHRKKKKLAKYLFTL